MDFICFAVFSLHLDSNMPLCYSAIPSRSLRRDGADLKGFGISQQVFCRAKFAFAQQSGAMKAPVELLSDRTVLRQQDGGALPRQARLTMHRMQTMQGKTRLSRRCAKSVQKCAEPQKMENPTRNLTILRGILVRSRELESLAL